MKKLKIILPLLALPFWVNADIYMTKNPDGSISYSDQPQQDSSKVTLQPINTIKPKNALPASESSDSKPAEKKEAPKEQVEQEEKREAYKSVTINSPKDDETLQNIVTLDVSASSVPELQKKFSDSYALYINGSKVADSTTGSFSIPRDQVPRGDYTLQVAILDKDGQTLITSSTITVHVKYHTIAI